jgi:hypothetical protein
MNLTKKSLGHFPFSEHEVDESEFSFIPDRSEYDTREPREETVVEEARVFDLNRELRDLKSETRVEEDLSRHIVEREIPEPAPEPAPKKKTASFYLEVDLVDRLRDYADDYDRSYSAVVTEAIEHLIDKYGY